MEQKQIDTTDEVLAKHVQGGDTAAFETLIQRYEAKLLRYGRRFLFNYEDVEDAVQEVFIKTYTNIQSFTVSRKFSSWIYRIAHNTFINLIKKKGREPVNFFDPDMIMSHVVADDRTQEELSRKDDRAMLEGCLSKLDVKYREVLILYYFEERNYKEIADILHLPASTVGVRLKRGKKAMKGIYDRTQQ